MLGQVAPPQHYRYRRLSGRCVNALAAAVFAALGEFGLRNTLDAALAALAEVTSLLPLRITKLLG